MTTPLPLLLLLFVGIRVYAWLEVAIGFSGIAR